MDYRTLRYIITVAEEQNISKAAQKLYLSQPSLSHCLLKQERSLGVRLFDRSKHPLQLTYAGERYVDAARQILNIKERLEKEMEDVANTKKGRINLGVTRPRSAYLLPHILPRYKELYPNVEIVLTEEMASVLESLLLTGKMELAILMMPIENEYLSYRHICDEEILLCVPPQHKIVDTYKEKGVDLRLLETEPFILYKTGQRVRKASDSLFAVAGFKPHILLETQTAETIYNLVAAGMGCAFLPKSVVQYSVFSPRPICFSLGKSAAFSSFAFAWHKETYLGWIAQEFMRLTQEVLGEAFQDYHQEGPAHQGPIIYTHSTQARSLPE